jgi:CPA1 family monovalent cation:H+ antiporter
MTVFQAIAILVVLTSLFSFFNFKYLKLPKTIGLMLLSLIVSIAAAALTGLGVDFVGTATQTIAKIDFSEAVLNVVLCFLLFAGALHIDLDAFMQERLAIAALSTLGVFISTVVVGIGAWLVFYVFGTSLPFVVCLLFGALISPTDPISVLALLKESKVPKSVEMQVAGEALLNDGVGVVLFLAILAVATGSSAVTPSFIAELVVREVIGGVALGLLTGYCAFLLLRQIDDYPIEILLSIALVVGGYALAAMNDGVTAELPVATARMARNSTTPTPSLRSASPATCISTDFGTFDSLRSASTEIGSVGDISAPNKRHTTNGSEVPNT